MNLKNTFYNSHIYVYVRFYCQILWFYEDFKSETLFFKSVLSSRSKNTGSKKSVTRDRVKSSQVRNETPLLL